MLKRTISIIIFFCMLYASHLGRAQGKDFFIINGHFKGLPAGAKVYLTTQERDTIASAVSTEEYFTFRGRLQDNGRFHFIKIDTLVTKIGTEAIFLTNDSIVVIGNIGSKIVNVTGAPSHLDYKEFHNLISLISEKQNEISNTLRSINGEISALGNDSNSVSLLKEKKDDLKKQIEGTYSEMKESGQKWFRNHANSLYTPYAIIGYKVFLNADEMKNEYEMLSSKARESYYGKKLIKEIGTIKLTSTIKEGSIIPNLRITTPDGGKTSLHDLASKNQYTLIDCWASWCSPCRAEVPTLKKIYSSFNKKGFGILGISSDKNEAKWKKALREDDTPWFQGIEDQDNSILKLFNINAIPSYILIDNRGKLIAFDCHQSRIMPFGGSLRGEELEKKIASLLSK